MYLQLMMQQMGHLLEFAEMEQLFLIDRQLLYFCLFAVVWEFLFLTCGSEVETSDEDLQGDLAGSSAVDQPFLPSLQD